MWPIDHPIVPMRNLMLRERVHFPTAHQRVVQGLAQVFPKPKLEPWTRDGSHTFISCFYDMI